MQKLSLRCCGQAGCDWGMTFLLLGVVALGALMACLAAFGQFANWNLMGNVSKAWSSEGSNDIISNGYGAHPQGNSALPSASGGRGGHAARGTSQNDKDEGTFSSSSADTVRDALGLAAIHGTPARIDEKKQTEHQIQVAKAKMIARQDQAQRKGMHAHTLP